MTIHKKLLYTAGVALLLGGTSLVAAEQSAKDIISKAYNYIGGMDQYAFDAIVTSEDATDTETAKKHRQDVSIKVDRPDKLRVDTKGDTKNRSTYVNDGLFTMIDHTYSYYGQLKTPKTIDGTLDFIFEKFGIKAPMASLVYSDMGKRVKFKKSKYFGTMDVAGTECDYVAFKSRAGEVHIWIATGDKPLVKTYAIIDTTADANPRMDTSLTWNTNPKISASDFIFKAPKGAAKISVEPAK